MSSFHSRARHVRVDDPWQRIGQVGQLVIVGGKERPWGGPSYWSPDTRLPPTRYLRPSKVEVPRPISSSTTRLCEETVCRDVGGLLHLHHERGLAAGDVIGGADAREDAVDDRQLCVLCGHEGAESARAEAVARSGADRSTYRPCSGQSGSGVAWSIHSDRCRWARRRRRRSARRQGGARRWRGTRRFRGRAAW